ncbi:SIR2 family NAD-dependent protein deacylase [Traorella massiliensis]|uniref:SIR2 family NAD-dependent protein deacylase n=1 Tax=Traorella massiliensis TaxID=1903263 RepID=UPI0023562773|nr:SIR2 family protein [Traorella massiliensis]
MLPYSLENDYLNKKCVLFIGAGISSRVVRDDGTRLPGWYSFVNELVEYGFTHNAIEVETRRDLDKMIKENKLIAVAQLVIDELKEAEFQNFLSEIFYNVKPNDAIYPLICQMYFRAIITTNFDTLIEDAFQMFASRKIKTWTQQEVRENLAQMDEQFLLKLHGTYERQGTVILGLQGYLKNIYKNDIVSRIMETLLISNSFLFIGYGLNDPDFNNLLDHINVISENNNRIHYLAVERGKISDVEKKYLKKHRNIAVLEYDNLTGFHEGLLDILEELKKKKAL